MRDFDGWASTRASNPPQTMRLPSTGIGEATGSSRGSDMIFGMAKLRTCLDGQRIHEADRLVRPAIRGIA